MLAGFLARRVFLSSALPDLSLARWLAREILSCACLPAAAQAVAPAAYSAPQADAEPGMLQTGQFSLYRVLGSPFGRFGRSGCWRSCGGYGRHSFRLPLTAMITLPR